MSEAKFTPGPWTAFYKSKYDEWHVSLPIAGSGMRLALAPDGIQSENREADANLIAAAPDMLAALDRIFSYVSYVTVHGVGEQPEPNGLPQPMRVPPDEFARIFQEIGRLASEAIAKAEGRQP